MENIEDLILRVRLENLIVFGIAIEVPNTLCNELGYNWATHAGGVIALNAYVAQCQTVTNAYDCGKAKRLDTKVLKSQILKNVLYLVELVAKADPFFLDENLRHKLQL